MGIANSLNMMYGGNLLFDLYNFANIFQTFHH